MDTTWTPQTIAPEGEVTAYDRRALLTYAELIDAADSGIEWEQGVVVILGVDPLADREAARRCWTSHLARARWIVGDGLPSAIAAFGRTTRA